MLGTSKQVILIGIDFEITIECDLSEYVLFVERMLIVQIFGFQYNHDESPELVCFGHDSENERESAFKSSPMSASQFKCCVCVASV